MSIAVDTAVNNGIYQEVFRMSLNNSDRDPRTKKTYYFRDRALIDGLVRDEAAVTRQTESGTVELHLLKSLLPANPNAEHCIRVLYSDAPPQLLSAYATCFEYLSAGSGWKSAEANARPLVECFRLLCVHAAPLSGDETELPYIAQRLGSVIELLARGIDETDPDSAISDLSDDMDFARESLAELSREPVCFLPINVISLLLRNWALTGNSTHTFRLLAAIARALHDVRDDPDSRYAFLKILRDVSSEWRI
jgi:hypothetical protein